MEVYIEKDIEQYLNGRKIRRINIFGGPGSGKSTFSSCLFSELKRRRYSIEFVQEYVKLWTYIPRPLKSFDNFYAMSKQIYMEDTILRNNCDFIITDSPVFIQYFYTKYNQHRGYDAMLKIYKETEEIYPSLNFFIRLEKDVPFDERGRYHTVEQAIDIEEKMIKELDDERIPYFCMGGEKNKYPLNTYDYITPALNLLISSLKIYNNVHFKDFIDNE